MELAAIQRIDIVATSNGVAQATAGLDALGRAHQGVSLASETTERATLSLERRVESISRKFDLQYRAEQKLAKVERDLSAARAQGLIGLDRQAQLMDLARQRALGLAAANSNVAGMVDKFGASVKSSSGQVGGIAAQFQDVAVQLAGGQSPFLIALQQGTQLSGQLEATGGGVKSLGAAFLSLVSPMSLATIGGIAAFGLLTQYLTSAGEKTQSLDDRLEAHSAQIRKIKDAYGDAVLGLEVYERESNRVLEVQLRQTTEKLKADLTSLTSSLAGITSSVIPSVGGIEMGLPTDLAGGVTEATYKYREFSDAIVRLRSEAAAGEPNIRAFRDAVATIGAASDDPRVRKMADELLALSQEAYKVEGALNASARAISALNGQAAAGIGDLAAYGKALTALSQIGLPNLTDRQKALQSYTEAVSKSGGFEERTAAARGYEAALKRIGEREAEEAAKARNRGGGGRSSSTSAEDAFERAIITARGRTQQLEAEIRLSGQAGAELEASKLRIDLETAAKKRGIEVSEAMRASIEGEVEARRRAAQALAESKLAADIAFERDQIGRSPGEAQIASRLRASGLGLDSAQADALRLNATLSETKDILGGAAKGFLADIRAGKTAAEALHGQVNRIVDRLLDAAVDQGIAALFGGKNSGGGLLGGFLSAFAGVGGGGATGGMGFALPSVRAANGQAFANDNLVRFATGGIVDRPTQFRFADGGALRNGLMGEAGPEAIMPLRRNASGQLGVIAAKSAAGSSRPVTNITNAPVYNIDARGADAAAVARLERGLAERDRKFARNVQSVARETELRGTSV